MSNKNSQVSFYHLTTSPFDKALFMIVGKVIEHDLKAFILTGDQKKTDEIDSFLWSLGRISFVPHATIHDDEIERHPIVIGDYIPNNLSFDAIISVDDRSDFDASKFSRVIDIFNGNVAQNLESARERWKYYKSNGFDMKYWCQDDKGHWQAKVV